MILYFFIGGISAIVNFVSFLLLVSANLSLNIARPVAFIIAATANYLLSISFLFRHKARWKSANEILIYIKSLLLQES
jgi:putative flippase GtrA